jgi:RHS repeat-associated protein
MDEKRGFGSGFFCLLILILSLLFPQGRVEAKPVGPDSFCSARPCVTCEQALGPCADCVGGSAISSTKGNLTEQYRVSQLKSAFGTTIDFSLTYNSYNADGSRAQIDTVLGYGWTHSYNIFLFSQRGSMFRMDGQGGVTKYQLGPGGTFTAPPGYFETLVRNPDGSFTLRQKDGTLFEFAFVPNTPFLVEGPVFRLQSITDRNNNTTSLSYDADGNLAQITDTYGRSLTLAYNTQNKLISVTDPLGRITTLEFDSTGRQLLKITDRESKATQYSYNFLYQMTRKIDRDGRVFTYFYNSQRKPVSIRDGTGAAFFILSNPNNWATDDTQLALNLLRVYIPSTTSKTDGRGNIWKYDYDSNGCITGITAPDAASTSYTYDPATLKVASMLDANKHSTSYEYDTLGNQTKITNALGHITTFTYEPVFSQMTSMTDPNGRVTTYGYDANGNRIKETDPLGNTREWTYDSHGNVLTEKDKNGNVTQHEYDAFGNRTKTTDAVGKPEQRQTTFTYDIVGNMLTRTDDNDHTTTFEYDGLDRLKKEIDPAGNLTQFFYDGEGNRTEIIDRETNSTVLVYDHRKRLIKTIDALKNFMTQTYDRNDNRTSVSDKNGHTTTFGYDVQNRLIRTTDALNNISRRTYDPVGNLLTETDANNHVTRYEYDALNRRTKRTDAVGCISIFDYDMVGLARCPECTGPTKGSSLVTKQIDGNDKVTYFKYDGLDRLILQIRKEDDTADIIDTSDAVTEFFYDPNGNRLAVIEPNGNPTTYGYDVINRRIREANAARDMTRFEYDGVGNLTRVFAPNGNVTTNSYDDRDRLIQVEDLVGLVATYSYDNVGNRLTDCDGNNNCTANEYDDIYRLIKVTDALGEMTFYDYDPVGNLLKVTDREGQVTCHTYDNINRRTLTSQEFGVLDCTVVDVDDIWTQYRYDAVGNLTALATAKNGSTPNLCNSSVPPADCESTRYQYDAVNRLIRETYPDPVPNTRTFTYDCVGNILTRTDQKGQVTRYLYNDLYFLMQRDYPVSPDDNFTYDLSGRMLTAERGGWLVTFDYDGANRVIQTTQNGQVINYVYDIPERTRTITYPGGRVITEQMDFRNRLDTVDDGLLTPVVQYTYDLGNRVGTRTYRNGTVASYTYNANNWVLELEHSFGLALIAGFAHEHDKEGNKKFEEKRHDTNRSEAYQYDTIYRLIDFKVGELVGSTVPVPLTQTHYNLDKLGNWDSKTSDSVTETRTHNAVNEITSINGVPIFHDNNGNLSEDETFRYAYDEENRLIQATRKSDNRVVGQYQYDALSRRIKKIADPFPVSSPVETRYFYDDARIMEEQNPAMMTLATYVYGNYIDEVLTMDRSGQTFYYHQNSLWSVEAITDSLANVVERYTYDAYGFSTIFNGSGVQIPLNSWGTPHSAIGNPWMFTGRQLDEETGLYYYRARYYDSTKGRFLQRDPLRYIGGMNLYSMVKNRVSRFVDPRGLTEQCDMPACEIKWIATSIVLYWGKAVFIDPDKIKLGNIDCGRWGGIPPICERPPSENIPDNAVFFGREPLSPNGCIVKNASEIRNRYNYAVTTYKNTLHDLMWKQITVPATLSAEAIAEESAKWLGPVGTLIVAGEGIIDIYEALAKLLLEDLNAIPIELKCPCKCPCDKALPPAIARTKSGSVYDLDAIQYETLRKGQFVGEIENGGDLIQEWWDFAQGWKLIRPRTIVPVILP